MYLKEKCVGSNNINRICLRRFFSKDKINEYSANKYVKDKQIRIAEYFILPKEKYCCDVED